MPAMTAVDHDPATGAAGSRPTDPQDLDLGNPLTVRILERVGRHRRVGILAWSAVPAISPLILAVVARATAGDIVEGPISAFLAPQLVLSYVVLVALIGTDRMTSRALATRRSLHGEPTVSRSGHDHGRATGAALSLASAVLVMSSAATASRFGPFAALAVAPFVGLALVPITVFLVTYVRLLIGLDRLGRARLAVGSFPQDRSLGLNAIGRLAFEGLALVLAADAPVLLMTSGDALTLVISLAAATVSVPLFFLSLWRLHRQMSAVKAVHVADARALYAEAYAPLRRNPSLDVLREQAPVLDAARALEERAQRILVWPIDEGLLAILGFVVAGVASGIVVRFVVVSAHL